MISPARPSQDCVLIGVPTVSDAWTLVCWLHNKKSYSSMYTELCSPHVLMSILDVLQNVTLCHGVMMCVTFHALSPPKMVGTSLASWNAAAPKWLSCASTVEGTSVMGACIASDEPVWQHTHTDVGRMVTSASCMQNIFWDGKHEQQVSKGQKP